MIVFVHGNPETAAVWDYLSERLSDAGYGDQLRLSPPGFGSEVAEGFQPTPAGYRDWLIGCLETLEAPVDLVGHDWGGGHTVNVAMSRPDLVRSWASDAVGLFDPDYVWHPLAQLWVRPGDGERWVADVLAQTSAERAALLASQGMEESTARKVAEGITPTMGRCILDLYRAAAQPVMAQLGTRLEAAAARPGLAVIATADSNVGTMGQRQRSAARAGARPVELDGFGHWWMSQDQGQAGAAALHAFWTSLTSEAAR